MRASESPTEEVPVAEDSAQPGNAVVEWDGTVNSIRMRLAARVVAFYADLTEIAILSVPLRHSDGDRERCSWHIRVVHNWESAEHLPEDLLTVTGSIAADHEGDPIMTAERVEVIRQGFVGSQRTQLMMCEDLEERWLRANRLTPAK